MKRRKHCFVLCRGDLACSWFPLSHQTAWCCCCSCTQDFQAELCSQAEHAFVAVHSTAHFTVRLGLLLICSNSGCFLEFLTTFFFSFPVQNLLTSSILKMPVSEEDGSFHKTFAMPRNRPLASPLQVTKNTLICIYINVLYECVYVYIPNAF